MRWRGSRGECRRGQDQRQSHTQISVGKQILGGQCRDDVWAGKNIELDCQLTDCHSNAVEWTQFCHVVTIWSVCVDDGSKSIGSGRRTADTRQRISADGAEAWI